MVEKPNAQVPLDIEFHDEDGRTVRLGDFFKPDRPVLLVLVYFQCPMLCNLTLNGVVEAIRPLRLTPGKDFEIVTVSFDPREGPELAKAEEGELREGAGQARGRRRLALPDQQPAGSGPAGCATPSASATSSTPRGRMYLHQAAIYVCTPDGRVARTIQGVEFDSDMLRDSLDRRLGRARSAPGCSAWPCPADCSISIRPPASTPGRPWPSCGSPASSRCSSSARSSAR